jgi:hypothetical protein
VPRGLELLGPAAGANGWGWCICVSTAGLLCTWRSPRLARQVSTARAISERDVLVSAQGKIRWRVVLSTHSAELTPAVGHWSASVLPAALQDGVVLTRRSDGDSATARTSLDAEAAYYRRRAIQEQQALGPGCYVDLLRDMATDLAAMAQRIRTGKAATR